MVKKIFLLSFLLLWIGAGCTTDMGAGGIVFGDLQTEMRRNPEGLGVLKPRFSWKFTSNKPDVVQKAYQIEVAASEKALNAGGSGLLWSSGRVESDASLFVEYAGKPLESGKKYYWRVTIWTNPDGSAQSDVQSWSTALFNDSDWKAEWIGINDPENLKVEDNRTILPARYLRREFETGTSEIVRAMLYISGVGSSTPYINGKQVGNDVFGPLPTWYDASTPYLTYDVTGLVKKGKNAIGVVLGNGRFLTMRERGMLGFGLPRLIAQLDIEYADGEHATVASDASWMATNRGPILENNEFDGEKYDARLALGKWTEAGYDASKWKNAERMEAPKGKLTAQLSPSLKVMEEVKPASVKTVDGGRYILDMGQNMVGWLQVRLHGKKDAPVTMRFAEALKPDGTELYVDNLRHALATDVYIPASDGKFTWEPMFIYHGFRFVEISGLDYEPAVTDFTGKVVYDEMATTGTFESSNEMLNKIYRNAYWGIRGNYRGMPTDCPQRDERLGWLGDRATGAHGESFLFNNALLYNKWLVDIEESMNEAGSISVVSPRYWTIFNDDVTWPSAYFYIADMLYRQFGDSKPIKERYPSMKKWIAHMTAVQMKDYILVKDTYGDWCMPPEKPELIHSEDPSRKTNGEALSTTVFYSILQLMQKFADMNGLPEDAAEYRDLAAKIKQAYNKKFFRPETAQYDNNTVTVNILSLQLGLVPEGYEEKVFANIVEKTEVDCHGHVSAGVLGIQHLMRGLTQHGGLELAYKIATNETYPSWGYMVKNGATTIWELWNGDTANPAMNSRNHVMLLGDLLIWFYENLAGIKNDPSSVGFKKIWMEPVFPEKLQHVDASFESPYGKIGSRWKRDGDKLSWEITIPANTTATVKLPLKFGVHVDADQDGVRNVKEDDGSLVLELGSGAYLLQSR
jgi:alpha-L-rhamnosidase